MGLPELVISINHVMEFVVYTNAPKMWVCYVKKEFARSAVRGLRATSEARMEC